jgi:hypothetical protein
LEREELWDEEELDVVCEGMRGEGRAGADVGGGGFEIEVHLEGDADGAWRVVGRSCHGVCM